MTKRSFELTVNGAAHPVVADGDTPLLYILRNELGLTGTRFGCGVGECGACHVLIDGKSVPSCDTSLSAAAGHQLLTVEGLATANTQGAVLHPLQQAFIDEQAAQCGYCLSGILMSAAALLAGQPDPSAHDVRATLDQHLCRCGSHNRIVRAVLRAARVMRDQAAQTL